MVTLSAKVVGATSCALVATPKLVGLPAAPPCKSGALSLQVAIPANKGKTPVSYALKLTATSAGKSTTALTTIHVDPVVAPKITVAKATPASTGQSGGVVHVQAVVSGFPDCTVSVTPALAGFPQKPSCLQPNLDLVATLPANNGSKSMVYTFTIAASNAAGSATATTSATVPTGPLPTISSAAAAPSTLSAAGGTVFILGSASGATSCSLTVSPSLSAGPWAPNCAGGSFSQQVFVPNNPSTAAVVEYTFTLKAQNTVGSVTKTTSVVVAALPITISSFSSSSSTLSGPGGQITLSGAVIGASTCAITVSPALTGAPWSPSCTGGSFSKAFTLPLNSSTTKAVVYTFTATVKNSISTKTATTTVTVAPLDITKVDSFIASQGPVSLLGGPVTLSGTVEFATSCTITVSPTLSGAPYSPSCSSGSLSQLVQLPKNPGAQAINYTFTLTGRGLAGVSTAKTVTVSVPAAMPTVTQAATATIVQPRGFPSSLSCPTDTFCAAVDLSGSAMVRSSGGWSAPVSVDQNSLNAVSCTSATFCLAVDQTGNALSFNGSTWSTPSSTGAASLTSVSCATSTSCRAVSDDGIINFFIKTKCTQWVHLC